MNKYTIHKRNTIRVSPAVSLILLCLLTTITIAFFSYSDFASNYVGMSGKVEIEAVGKGTEYASIEDTDTLCRLVVDLDKGYNVLIPGMPIRIDVNCKVMRSTTKPLLRAFLSVNLLQDAEVVDNDTLNINQDINSQLDQVISKDNDWYFHTDGYYYYTGDINNSGVSGGAVKLKEIDATKSDVIVPFIDEAINFPNFVTSEYSGMNISFSITFQAIQNYIPDEFGKQLPNTITNSLKIFNDFESQNSYKIPSLDKFNITNSDGKVTISVKPGVSLPENIILPDATSDGTPITNIASNIFKGNVRVKNVIVPSSYRTLDKNAFADSVLISVDLSNTQITEIPDNAFYRAGIVSIKLPPNLSRIGKNAFWQSTLSSIDLPDTLTIIDNGAFWDCKLRSLYIPKNVSVIGTGMLYSGSLKQIIVDEENQYYEDIDNVALVSKSGDFILLARSVKGEFVIPDNITTLKTYSLRYNSELTSLQLGANVSSIENDSLPRRLTTISVDNRNNYFASENGNSLYNKDKTKLYLITSSVTNYSIPETVNEIYTEAFSSVSNTLQYLHIHKDIKSLSFLVNLIALKGVTISSENTDFRSDDRAVFSYDGKKIIRYFGGNDSTTYEVPSGVETIGTSCFIQCSKVQKVILPDGLKTIGTQAFYNSGLTEINLPSTITSILHYAFLGTKISTLDLPEMIDVVYGHTFHGCARLTSININVSTISGSAFISCSGLKNVVLGSKLRSMEASVFSNCTRLESIEFQSEEPPTLASANLFLNTNNTFKIYVPDASLEAYRSATYFNQYASQILPISSK